MRTYWKGACLMMAALLFSFTYATKATQAADATTLGQWSTLPYNTPINPIHVALLRNGNVLIVAGSENDPKSMTHRAALWNRATGTITAQNIAWDLFCNAMSFLPDGRVLIAGGTARYDPFYGAGYAILYNPANNQFTAGPEMADGRWYPTSTTLSDGKTVVISGLNRSGGINRTIEIFNPATTSWSPPYTVPFAPPLYPWGYLVSAGRFVGNIVYAGPDAITRVLNPTTHTWVTLATTNYGANRKYGSSVLLPLSSQDGYVSKVLIMGGNSPATNTVERINLSDGTPRWATMRPLANARIELNATMLPNGQVLATGGSRIDEDASTAAFAAELYDPATNTWSTKASAEYARLYHSVALLLPDATVWSAGSNPARGVWQPKMEIFKPPYLFTKNAAGTVVLAPRPNITSAPANVAYNAPSTVGVSSASGVGSVMLIRPGAVTHARDMEQRAIKLSFATLSATSLRVTSPPNSNVAPPGYYMLFVLDTKGVPSIARFVHLG